MTMHNPLFLAITAAAKARVREISVSQTKQLLTSTHPPLLIDVREDHEWQVGHLPNAIHLGKGIIERDIEKTVPNLDTPMVLYCGGGSRSALAADALQTMGYTQVVSMNGGFRGWLAAGHPTVTELILVDSEA